MRRLLSLTGSFALLTLVFALPVTSAHAQVVYDNGSFLGTLSGVSISTLAVADDFTVASSLTFNAIRFFAIDVRPGLLGEFSGTLNWAIHTSSGVTPDAIPSDTIVASGTTSLVSITDTGVLLGGFADAEVAQLDFSFPSVTLPAGTYWLRIDEGLPASASDGSIVGWLHTVGSVTGNNLRGDNNKVAPSTWDADFGEKDLAFQLLNNQGSAAAPEPGTLALLGGGYLGTLWVAGVGMVWFGTHRRKR